MNFFLVFGFIFLFEELIIVICIFSLVFIVYLLGNFKLLLMLEELFRVFLIFFDFDFWFRVIFWFFGLLIVCVGLFFVSFLLFFDFFEFIVLVDWGFLLGLLFFGLVLFFIFVDFLDVFVFCIVDFFWVKKFFIKLNGLEFFGFWIVFDDVLIGVCLIFFDFLFIGSLSKLWLLFDCIVIRFFFGLIFSKLFLFTFVSEFFWGMLVFIVFNDENS